MDFLKLPSFSSSFSEENAQTAGARRGRMDCMTVKELRERAKAKKIKGFSSMNKATLIAAIRSKKSPSSKRASSPARSRASPSPFLGMPPKV